MQLFLKFLIFFSFKLIFYHEALLKIHKNLTIFDYIFFLRMILSGYSFNISGAEEVSSSFDYMSH